MLLARKSAEELWPIRIIENEVSSKKYFNRSCKEDILELTLELRTSLVLLPCRAEDARPDVPAGEPTLTSDGVNFSVFLSPCHAS